MDGGGALLRGLTTEEEEQLAGLLGRPLCSLELERPTPPRSPGRGSDRE